MKRTPSLVELLHQHERENAMNNDEQLSAITSDDELLAMLTEAEATELRGIPDAAAAQTWLEDYLGAPAVFAKRLIELLVRP